MFSDPLKLIPAAIAAVALVGLVLNKITVNECLAMLGAAGVVHPLISSVNNVNPPK